MNRIILFIPLLFLAVQTFSQIPELWGTTRSGGSFTEGTIFKVNGDGTAFQSVHSFDTLTDGARPYGNLLKAADGLLYGLTAIYGPYNGGSIYSIDPVTLAFQVRFLFHASNLSSISQTGSNPSGTLIQLANGLLYGMTTYGGANNKGIIFSFNTSNDSLSVLHDFIDSTGYSPWFGQLINHNGLLYGMTYVGGSYGKGVIFSIDPVTHTYQNLHDFNGLSANPQGSLIIYNGMFYGLTYYGSNGSPGMGSIFRFNPSNNSFQTLFNFDNILGHFPHGSPLIANGKIYGLTSMGGTGTWMGNGECGIIFSYDLSTGAFTVLHNFDYPFGCGTHGSFMLGTDGDLYATSFGGQYRAGTVFKMDTTTYSITYIHNFDSINGRFPMADLIEVTTVATSIENGSLSFSDLQIISDTYKNGARFKINTNKDFECGKIITIDFSGRTINSFNITKNEITNEFILVDLIPGVYITSLILDQEPISTKKFVILK